MKPRRVALASTRQPLLPVADIARALPIQQGTPCDACPLHDPQRPKVPPAIPPNADLITIGLGPAEQEEKKLTPQVGEGGALLRAELTRLGLCAGSPAAPRDPAIRVGYANLTRCRPPGGDFESSAWKKAADRCGRYLREDIAGASPLLLLGREVFQRMTREKTSLAKARGLWMTLEDGREAFITHHPAHVVRETRHWGAQCFVVQQFRADLALMLERLRGREAARENQVTVFRSVADARDFLAWLRAGTPEGRWYFDVETFDARITPSRIVVATNPYHADYRLRGVAIAYAAQAGVWIECMGEEDRKTDARALLDRAFVESPDEKGAFYGNFDVDALIVPGWVTAVTKRTRDPWLAAIALDMVGGGHSLERLVVEVLKEPQPRGKQQRGLIRTLTVDDCARYAVADACYTFRLDEVLQARLEAGDYLR